jgi:glutamyl-tRNA synthetase
MMDAEAEAKLAAEPKREEIGAALRAALSAVSAESWTADTIKDSVTVAAESLGLKAGKLMLPLRVLTTGKVSGPDLMPLLAWLGRESTLERFPC